jgi:integrase
VAEKILSKAAIRRLRTLSSEPDLSVLCFMAEKYRQAYRQRRRDARRRPKRYLKPTDVLSPEEIKKLLAWSMGRADESRAAGEKMSREITDEMIVLFFLGSGLRAEEGRSLKIKDTPYHHRKNCVWVEKGKGGKDRTVWISAKLAGKIIAYIEGFASREPADYFFRNERGGQLSYGSLISKIKRIGRQAGILIAKDKNGKVKSGFHTHILRHTFATLLRLVTKDSPDSIKGIKDQLGHEKEETTNIYIHAAREFYGCEMELFQKQLSFADNDVFPSDFIENTTKQQEDGLRQGN